jgi:hypothetical protein
MQFTIGAEAHDNFRRLQALLRREFPDGDPGAIVERALALLLEKVEKTKLAAASRPRPTVIRSGTDSPTSGGSSGRPSRRPAVGQLNGPRRDWITADYGRPAPAGSHTTRYIPRDVKRAVWSRDAGQCAFQSAAGARCSERAFLEFHHIQPYARQGTATVTNISLRCRRHNQYEAELVFGPATRRLKREPTVT